MCLSASCAPTTIGRRMLRARIALCDSALPPVVITPSTPCSVQMRQFGRRDRVADQHAADARGDLALGRRGVARQRGLHAADHVIDVFAAAAQVRIVDRLERRDEAIALHLQRGAGAIATLADQVVQAADQFRVVENQAVRVDELADFARQRAMQFFAQLVQFVARGAERGTSGARLRASTSSAGSGRSSMLIWLRLHQARAPERHAACGGRAGDDDTRAHAPSSNLRSNNATIAVHCGFGIVAIGAQRDRRCRRRRRASSRP